MASFMASVASRHLLPCSPLSSPPPLKRQATLPSSQTPAHQKQFYTQLYPMHLLAKHIKWKQILRDGAKTLLLIIYPYQYPYTVF